MFPSLLSIFGLAMFLNVLRMKRYIEAQEKMKK